MTIWRSSRRVAVLSLRMVRAASRAPALSALICNAPALTVISGAATSAVNSTATMVNANGYLIESEWGQLVFIALSIGAMTYCRHLVDRWKDR
ncbi:hypothetical protein [Streptomyces sp. NPDC057939]|uniref:hypothetical protein n=1 Tax=Streptomyces sp. NPDC057939 TaxID=3346284 RepID=UPI0036E87B0F